MENKVNEQIEIKTPTLDMRYAMIYQGYFSDKGLTMTSANHVANLAKQAYQKDEAFLNSLNLVNENIQIIGQEAITPSKVGATAADLGSVPEKLNFISNCKAFIAWLREAIKAKEMLLQELQCYGYSEWNIDNPDPNPVSSTRKTWVTSEVDLSIGDKAKMLYNEAKAATFGSYIHPSGALDNMYKRYIEIQTNKLNVDVAGRDTIISTFEPSVSSEVVEGILDSVRAEWRETEAKFNKQKYDLEKLDEKGESECKFENENNERQRKIRDGERQQQYRIWYEAEAARLDALKIVVPEMFKPLYEHLTSLGKKK